MCWFHHELQNTILHNRRACFYHISSKRKSHTAFCLSSKQSDFMCACIWGEFSFLHSARYAVPRALWCFIFLCWCILFFFIEYSGAWLLFFASMEIGILCCCFYDFLTTFYNAIYLMLFSSVFLRKLLFSYHLWIWFFLASHNFFLHFF